MSHSNPTAGVHRVFLGLLALLALGFWATSVFAQSTADIYYIHPDHLNTPRVITNNVNQVVWRWDNLDPFGANLPNENPQGLGNFTCNLRLPGQYFDRETKLHYNYFRDYDPAVGRYVESDPIGLSGGINTYGYVGGNPLSRSDPSGLVFPIIAACALNPACATSVMVGGTIALGGLFNRPSMSSGKDDGDNVIPFPGSRGKPRTDDYCPPDDGCKRDQDQLLRDRLLLMGLLNNRLVDISEYRRRALEFNARVDAHNLRCPNQKVGSVPLGPSGVQ